MKRTLALILVALMLLASCAPAPTPTPEPPAPSATASSEPTPTETATPRIMLTKEQMLEDYEFLWQTLRESYPFLGVAERLGVNVDRVYSTNKEEIENGGDRAVVSYQKFLYYAINPLYTCGHLGVLGANDYKTYYSTYSSIVAGNAGARFELLFDVLQQPHVREAYASLGVVIDDSAPLDTYVGEAHPTSDVTPITNTSVSKREVNGQSVGIIKVPSFLYGYEDADAVMLRKFYKEIADYDHLIIDITGNGGGSSLYWREHLVSPLISEPMQWSARLLFKNSDIANTYIDTMPWLNKKPISELPTLPALNQDDLLDLDGFILSESQLLPAEDSINFKGRIWLLVDEIVYSNAEAFTVFCKTTGFATIIGTPTAGDGINFDPFLIALPNSGIVVRFSVLYGINPDGSNNEEFGTTPDIITETGTDAMTACLAEIERLNT